jgi:hypothetical protein
MIGCVCVCVLWILSSAAVKYGATDLCDCEAVAQIRFRHLGQFFMDPSDYYDAPIDKVLHFIRGVGLIKG